MPHGGTTVVAKQPWFMNGLWLILPTSKNAGQPLGKVDAHKKWSKNLEPYVVSGSARWEAYRVV